jgi:hypothetical protein
MMFNAIDVAFSIVDAAASTRATIDFDIMRMICRGDSHFDGPQFASLADERAS